jgi:hypothetical protein
MSLPYRVLVLPRSERVSALEVSAFRSLSAMALIAAWVGGSGKAAAATYRVGPTRSYTSVAGLPRLGPGDVVEIDPGTYHEVKRWTTSGSATQPIVIRGVSAARPVFDATGQNVSGSMPHPRAVFQVEAHFITVENLEFRNARNGDNGAGIRVTAANNAIVRNCRITSCDMGIMSDRNTNLLIEASEVASNGTSKYDGYSHNFYVGGDSVTVKFCYIHDSLYGQNFKSRAHDTELLYGDSPGDGPGLRQPRHPRLPVDGHIALPRPGTE